MRRGNWGLVVASVALAGAALLFGAAVTRAMLRTPVAAATAPEAAPAGTEAMTAETATPAKAASAEVPGEVLSLAVERAPFDPDRRAPDQRYLMPGERVERPVVRAERPEPPPAPDFRVLGTIAGPNGGVAVIQVDEDAPRVIAMGTEILGYRVASIDGGRVVMSGQGRNLALEVPDAVPSAQAAANNQRGNQRNGQAQGGRGNQNQNTRNQNQAREAERAQNQVRERVEQLIQQAGGGRFQMQGDRVTFTDANGQRREVQIPDNVGRVQVAPNGNVTFQRGRGPGGGGL
jgi:hypothetical protein